MAVSPLRTVSVGLGFSLLTGIMTLFYLMFNARTCSFVIRLPFAWAGAALVALFTLVRYGLFVAELKVESWLQVVNFGNASAAAVEEELNRRLTRLRAMVWSPPWLPPALYSTWRIFSPLVLPVFLVHDPTLPASAAKSPFVGEVVQPVVTAQFRAARMWTTIVMVLASTALLSLRYVVAPRAMLCLPGWVLW